MECLKIDYPGQWNTTPQLAERIMVDLWRNFWLRETGTDQQVAQLHERYMMMMKYQHINIFIWLPLDWNRAILQKVADNGIQHEHFCPQCLGCKYSMLQKTRCTTVTIYVLQNLLVLYSSLKWHLKSAWCSLMSRCSKYWHGLPWQCHLERRAARYSGRPSLRWPLTSVSLARGKKLSPWPGTQISKAFSIFETTAVAQHTRECNFAFVYTQSPFPNFTQICQEVSNVAQ